MIHGKIRSSQYLEQTPGTNYWQCKANTQCKGSGNSVASIVASSPPSPSKATQSVSIPVTNFTPSELSTPSGMLVMCQTHLKYRHPEHIPYLHYAHLYSQVLQSYSEAHRLVFRLVVILLPPPTLHIPVLQMGLRFFQLHNYVLYMGRFVQYPI
eukprot:TRINITY_DN8191_c0_g1_i1.p1 TRINITY_DN8191_c0_g1~~TRINITY_DN8191_c0_g1_i1.p1  ORF type:complete len:154 (-),score=14.62 TRINITY_DN8191_c0_g1_i1:298-759(-)